MSAFRIHFNTLPDKVLERVLQVGAVEEDNAQWRLLRSGNTRKTYRFTPTEGDSSWVVKWGYRSYTSWKKIGNILLGRDAAKVEWELTLNAKRRGIHVLDFDLVAGPNLPAGSFQTLLVMRYQENACNFLEYLARHWNNDTLIERALIKLADEIALIHKAGLLHRDLSLDNVLVCGEAERVIAIDWFKSHSAPARQDEGFFSDFLAPLSDMIYAGLSEERRRLFLTRYEQSMPWCKPHLEAMLQKAWKIRYSVCRRSYRNCTRRSRRLIQYRSYGFKVYQFKAASRTMVERILDEQQPGGEVWIEDTPHQTESKLQRWWRIANLLQMTGVKGHCVAAYARRWGWLRTREVLIFSPDPRAFSLARTVDSDSDPKWRGSVLQQAGRYVRRLHDLGIGFRELYLEEIDCVPLENGQFGFYCKNLEAYYFVKSGKLAGEFFWLSNAGFSQFNLRDLLRFLRGYGYGVVDRDLLQQILEAIPVRAA